MKFILMFLFFFCTFLCLCSKTMFFLWTLLELNIILYVSMANKLNQSMMNSLIKYFIIQSMSSGMFIIMMLMKNYNIMQEHWMNLMIMLTMWIKMGMFPFSSWFFQISENMNWNMYLYLNFIQKIIPLSVIYYTLPSFYLTCYLVTMNSFYSSIEMWMQSSLRWLMNCSSLNHMSWIILSMHTNNYLWETYFTIYSIILFMMYYFMKMFNINTLWNWTSINKQKMVMINFMVTIANFMGLPPFLGFLPKLMILIKINFHYLLLTLLMNNIIMSFMYMYLNLNMITKYLTMKMNQTTYNWKLNMNILMTMTPLILMMLNF